VSCERNTSPRRCNFAEAEFRISAEKVPPLSPEPDNDENLVPLGRGGGAPAESLPLAAPLVRPLRGPQLLSVTTPTDGVSTPQSLFIGPTNSGKTETISSGQAAWLAVHDPTWQLK
jgi:hypothetical protein